MDLPQLHIEYEAVKNLLKKSEVSEVLEWTFKYDYKSKWEWYPYNTTFFTSIGWVSYDEWISGDVHPSELIERVLDVLSDWQSTIQNLIQVIHTMGATELQGIEEEGLYYIDKTIEMARYAVPIELEKSYSKKILSAREKQDTIEMIETIQTELYGGKISHNIDEIHLSLALIREEWQEYSHYLSEWEQQEYRALYQEMITVLKWAFPDEPLEDIEFRKEINVYTKSQDLIIAENTPLIRSAYVQLLQLYIDAHDMPQEVMVSENVSSIFDGSEKLEIPSVHRYSELDLLSVMLLMMHEIGVHYINQKISEDAWLMIRWAYNIQKEEGLAILMERLFVWKTLAQAKTAGFNFPYTLAAEILSITRRRQFINLRIKLTSKGRSHDEYHQRDLRVMRGYPLDYTGSPRKDMSYGRWLLKIITLLESGQYCLSDFFVGKFGIQDIASWRIDTVIPKTNRNLPLFFPDALLMLLQHGDSILTRENFWEHIREKYWHILQKNEIDTITCDENFLIIQSLIEQYNTIKQV